ncbi:hypothetical protein [Allosphingosinicella indica]|uniref:Uncharacterized protein n=1 Tax=Allosphingosinicella indica TaxID=941907 RepID=A0A1X7G3J0_9SPHN|nr:hypothetical protein [Allosphingosinicella indica]SMF63439.1 hypothetical protein SAMN06295910_1078 [Allosphingosinicella indica]
MSFLFDWLVEFVVGTIVFGFCWLTGYVVLRGLSGGALKVRSYSLMYGEHWPTDERGVYAWAAIVVGAAFWASAITGAVYFA